MHFLRDVLTIFSFLLWIQFINALKSITTSENHTISPIHFPLNDSSLIQQNSSNVSSLDFANLTEKNASQSVISLNSNSTKKRSKRRKGLKLPPGFDPTKSFTIPEFENKTLTDENQGTNSSVVVSQENTTTVPNSIVDINGNETRYIDLLQDLRMELIVSRGVMEEPLVEGEIFRDGKLSKFFRTCATEEEALNSEQIYPFSERECFRDSEYTDRIQFRYYYDSQLFTDGLSVDTSAQINHMQDTVAASYISNERVRTLTATEPSGMINIYYGCMENATETLSLAFTVKNSTNSETIKMTWEKYCQTGIARHVQMKSDSNSRETIFWPPEIAMSDIAVSPSQMSTSLDIVLDRKYLQQYFIGPFVNQSDASVVKTTLRGTESRGGILHSDLPVHFNIMYACKGAGVSEITFTMAVPPFYNVTATWMKECGGKIPPNLVVGTKSRSDDVVQAGVVREPYQMLDSQLGTPHSDLHKHLETNLTAWKLYISTASDEESSGRSSFGLHMGHPVITIENPSIVYASTSKVMKIGKSSGKSRYNYNDQSVILRDDEELEVSFSLVCLKIGESRVFISLPMLHYDAVEFGFSKLCESIPRHKKSSAFTVKTFFSLLSILLVLVAGTYGYKTYKKRKERIRYEGLTTLES